MADSQAKWVDLVNSRNGLSMMTAP